MADMKRNGGERVAWKVREWAQAVSLSPSYVHRLISDGKITSVRLGHTRLITTSPQDFIKALPPEEAPAGEPSA